MTVHGRTPNRALTTLVGLNVVVAFATAALAQPSAQAVAHIGHHIHGNGAG